MTIAPIVRTVTVKLPPDRAFAAFAGGIGTWWKRGVGAEPHVDVVIEPHAEGRWYEVDANGVESQWGKVLAWDPPHRLLLAWQLDAQWKYDPGFVTELELSFEAVGGGTLVTLEHRDLERYGAIARTRADQLGGGWPTHLQRYAEFAEKEEQR